MRPPGLTPEEKALIAADLAEEQAAKQSAGGHHPTGTAALLMALKDRRVGAGLVGCGTYTLANATAFWSPLIISASGVRDVMQVGLLAGHSAHCWA